MRRRAIGDATTAENRTNVVSSTTAMDLIAVLSTPHVSGSCVRRIGSARNAAMLLVAAAVVAVGALWLLQAERLTEGLRTKRLLTSAHGARHVAAARAFGAVMILFGIVIVVLVALGTVSN